MPRQTVFVIVEGQTENAVLQRLLWPYFSPRNIDIHFPIVKTGAGRGGVKYLTFPDFTDQIQRHLRDKRKPYVTTFFDYYGLPTSHRKGWQFIEEAKQRKNEIGVDSVLANIQAGIKTRVIADLDLENIENRFLPYVQLHELEALFFSDPQVMADAFGKPELASDFNAIVAACRACELINDSPDTAPSKRIEDLFPGYKKGRSDLAHGPRIVQRLPLGTIRAACPRFSHWISSIESLIMS
jgi:hypothetical protein